MKSILLTVMLIPCACQPNEVQDVNTVKPTTTEKQKTAKAVPVAAEKVEANTLRMAAGDHFAIGAAIAHSMLSGKDDDCKQVAATQFNTLTAENAMKWGQIHPDEKRFIFKRADTLVEFAKQNDQAVIGHVLVWHNQTPKWVFTGADGKTASREELLARMKTHMEAVMGHYKGSIKGWDVVNEAFTGKGSLRNSGWRKIIGDDFIVKAFEFAHTIDPHVELYYNDYGMTGKGKRQATVTLVKELKAKGIRIDGVGMQGHWSINYPKLEDIEASIVAFAEAGVKVHITELDVDVLPYTTKKPSEGDLSQKETYNKKYDPYRDGLPDAVQKKLAKRYADIFKLFIKHRDTIDRVTFWGVTDKYTWKNNFPVKGRINHPLLFDRDGKPKPAYHAVMKVLKEPTAERP